MTEAAPPPRKIKLVMGTSGPRIWWEDGAHIGENWKDQPVHEYALVESIPAMSDLAERLRAMIADRKGAALQIVSLPVSYAREILAELDSEPTRIRAAVEAETERAAVICETHTGCTRQMVTRSSRQ